MHLSSIESYTLYLAQGYCSSIVQYYVPHTHNKQYYELSHTYLYVDLRTISTSLAP
jgi:hypothetical protein